jgi:uncharacterized membrane protein
MKTKFVLLTSLIWGLIIISCENNIEKEFDCFDQISYNQTIKVIIENNCLQCHNGDDNSIPDWRTYQEVSDYADKIQELTLSRVMPKEGSLTNEEIKAIYCWVEQGALNN